MVGSPVTTAMVCDDSAVSKRSMRIANGETSVRCIGAASQVKHIRFGVSGQAQLGAGVRRGGRGLQRSGDRRTGRGREERVACPSRRNTGRGAWARTSAASGDHA
jgi:hypothetical protein